MKGLEQSQDFSERIQILVRPDKLDSITKAAQRIAELTQGKKNYSIIDTTIEDNTQIFILEPKEGA
jgi:multidrug efflux pump subunit AcrB